MKQRLILGFGCVLALMAVVFIIVGVGFLETQKTTDHITQVLNPQVKAADSLALAVTRERTALRGYVLTGEERHYNDFKDTVVDRNLALTDLTHILTTDNDKEALALIQSHVNKLNQHEPRVFSLLESGKKNAAYNEHINHIRPASESIADLSDSIAERGHERINKATGDLQTAGIRLVRLAWVALVMAMLLSALIIWLSVRAIAHKTRNIAEAAGAVAAGKYDKALTLEKSFRTNRGMEAVPRDELRVIALAVRDMSANLKKREHKLKAYADVSAVCASSLELAHLLDNSLTELARHTDSQVAVAYIRDDEGFHVGSIYGITQESADEALSDPEGLVKQAARSRQPVILSNIPQDTHFMIKPGLGKALPKSIACIPMVVESETVGVVVLASWHSYDPDAVSLMETSVAQIAVAISNAISHLNLQQLTLELEQKNDELDAQNETLQAHNEEIQTQNEELQAQNEEIQAQSEEIQAQSEEIQAQNEELAGQRSELQQRTVDLESYTRDLITVQSINAVALASLDQEELLRGLIDTISFALELDFGLVKLYDNQRRELRTLSTHNLNDPESFVKHIGHEFATKVIEARHLLSVEETQLGSLLSHPFAIRANIKSLIALPLISSGKVLGAAMFGSSSQRVFTDREKQLLQVFADRAALAVERVQSYERLSAAEKHARSDHERLHAIIENMPEGVVIVNAPDGRMYMMNRAARKLYGQENPPDAVVQDHHEVFNLYQTDGELFEWQGLPLSKSLLSGEVCTGEEVLIRQPGGSEVVVLCNTVPIRDENGEITGALGVFQDISEIKERQKMLQEGYEHQRHIAETLQKSFMPTRPFTVQGYEIGDRYIPAAKDAEVGGDFYDVIELDDDRMCVVMADVSGKGVKAAVHTAMTKYMLRAFALENPEPTVVLQKLNNAVAKYITEDMFVTLFYGLLHTKEGRLVFANAGHERPLLRRADEDACVALDSTGPALGILPGKSYQQIEMMLGERDSLVLYTDGITEARCDDQFLGQEGLEEMLSAIGSACAKDMTAEILARVNEFARNELRDDVALLVIKACE